MCLRQRVCVQGGVGLVLWGCGANKLSQCRKVCSSKSHLPMGKRAMPKGCGVKGQSVALQNTQITYQLQSINWLLSLLQTPTIVFLLLYRLNNRIAQQ